MNLTLLAARLSALIAAVLAFASCVSTKISQHPVSGSDPQALALLTASQRAHGETSFATFRDLKSRTAGTWSSLGSRSLGRLADRRFDRESEDALDLAGGSMVRLQNGPGGRKFVFRGAGRMAVWYNGQADAREDVIRAAAVDADLAKLFLLGPFYFRRSGVSLETAGTGKVDGAECDHVLAVLRPGFGEAEEDRVLLSIDRETQRLRRATLTLNGTPKTRGREVDVTFRNWAQRSGVWWPTKFDEHVHGLLNPAVHRWTLLDVHANRGFAPRQPELIGEALGAAAAAAAAR